MLAPKIIKYLNHKLVLATKSSYYQMPEKKQVLDWAYSVRNHLKYNNYLTDKEVALLIMPNEKNLFKLLPAPKNKSFQSSLNTYNEIKNQLLEIFKKRY